MTESSLQITTQLNDDHWVITAEVLPGSFLPAEIFMYENTGTDQLGSYVGVCGKDELLRLRIWEGQPIPKFGNRFVRHSQAKIIIDAASRPTETPQIVINNMIRTAKMLSLALQTASSTTQIVTV